VKHIVDNLSKQHRHLAKIGSEMFGWLDAGKLRKAGGVEAHRCIATLTGVLRVHLTMEDRSFYPGLLDHKDPELRALAARLLDERRRIERRYEQYRERWATASAIVAAPEAFIDDSREILGLLWQRMHDEDERFHPEIIARFG
jgi:hypothetical protein